MRSSLLSNSSFTYVLYAEDDPINIIVMKNYLSFFEEIKLVWVENGLEAVKLIKKDYSSFDIIFIDCNMPI